MWPGIPEAVVVPIQRTEIENDALAFPGTEMIGQFVQLTLDIGSRCTFGKSSWQELDDRRDEPAHFSREFVQCSQFTRLRAQKRDVMNVAEHALFLEFVEVLTYFALTNHSGQNSIVPVGLSNSASHNRWMDLELLREVSRSHRAANCSSWALLPFLLRNQKLAGEFICLDLSRIRLIAGIEIIKE